MVLFHLVKKIILRRTFDTLMIFGMIELKFIGINDMLVLHILNLFI